MAEFYLSAFADEAADSLDGQIEALTEAGIRFIEPRSVEKKGILDLTEEELSDMRRCLDAAGIHTGSLGSPIGKYGIHENFETYKATFERALTACRILGTDKMRIFSFFTEREELSEVRPEVLCRLTYLTERAAAYGVTLCHENEARIYGQMPCEVSDLLRSVPALGGIFDPANYIVCGADPMEGLAATLPSLAYLHIKDASREDGSILPAGEGDGRIGEVLDLVNAHTDAPVMLTVEPHLRLFNAYASIDTHTLKNRHAFQTNRESFAYAVRAIEGVLTERGYHKGENGRWKK